MSPDFFTLKASLSGEGVANDRKCGRYKAYTAPVGSAPLYELFKIHELSLILEIFGS